MKVQLDKNLIEALNDSDNKLFLANLNERVFEIMENVVADISLKTPFVKTEKVFFQPVNEINTEAISQLSEYTYFLGIDNPQIETNSKTRKNFWKNVWKTFRASWRIGRRKKYKKMKETPTSLDSLEKYKLSDFKHDVVMQMAEYLQESSIIYEYENCLTIIGNEDFGTNVRIRIYVCSLNIKSRTYKLYNTNRNKFFEINFGQRFINLKAKEKVCGKNFYDMIKIFNALFSRAYNEVPNQILVESLIYDCPNNLFIENDTYATFINVANYIRLANPRSFASICDAQKNIFEESLIVKANQQTQFGKIINMLDNFKF